jgi:hypothetical protein
MFQGFVEWLERTPASLFLSDTTGFWTWLIIPVSQCIHIVSIAVLLIPVGMLNLRLLGLQKSRQSFAQLAAYFMPWIWTSLIVLFVTGTVQTVAEPGRELLNVGFKVKMVLLAVVVLVTLFYERSVKHDPQYWELSPERRRMGKLLASVSLILWIGIATSGRLIAYLDMRRGDF